MTLRGRSFSVVACVAAFVALTVSGCGDKSNPVSAGTPAIVGTWNLTTITMGAYTINAGNTTMTNVSTYNGNYTYKSITIDYMNSPATKDTATGTWITSGNKLINTPTGTITPDTATYSISGNTLNVAIADTTGTITMVYARQ